MLNRERLQRSWSDHRKVSLANPPEDRCDLQDGLDLERPAVRLDASTTQPEPSEQPIRDAVPDRPTDVIIRQRFAVRA